MDFLLRQFLYLRLWWRVVRPVERYKTLQKRIRSLDLHIEYLESEERMAHTNYNLDLAERLILEFELSYKRKKLEKRRERLRDRLEFLEDKLRDLAVPIPGSAGEHS